MRKIVVGAQVSVDGVMQAPGAPQEAPTKGFEFGGWAMPYFDAVFGEEIDVVRPRPHRHAVQEHQEVRSFPFGRRRYELAGLGAAA